MLTCCFFTKIIFCLVKVNISDVSNNWNISHRESETILLEWIDTNKKQPLNKEFLIRGVDKSGNCVITVRTFCEKRETSQLS